MDPLRVSITATVARNQLLMRIILIVCMRRNAKPFSPGIERKWKVLLSLTSSNEAIELLEFENSKLGGMGRIRHKRNSLNGEVKVPTPAQDYFVDGFNAETRTVYEYQGCLYHGCKQCFPSSAMLRGTLIQIKQSMRSMRQCSEKPSC